MNLKKFVLLAAISAILPLLVIAQNTETKTDTSSKSTTSKVSKPKPYREVVTTKAITDSGLFIVHKVDDRYYFEITDSLFERDILTVNRIAKAAAGIRPMQGTQGYAGDEIGENVIRFSKGPNNKIFLKKVAYRERSSDSTDNGMYRSLLNSSLLPIVASFDIKAFSLDSSGSVIDITDFVSGDNDILFFDYSLKGAYGAAGLQQDKSYISKIQAFPLNVEIRTVKSYAAGSSFITWELNSSIVLLPKVPMKPRYADNRIGYFSTWYKDFDANPQAVELTQMIKRWRLEPKKEDEEKYRRGELVEPKKPIVFYIDPCTPKKWVPYLIQGVNDWQKAFEKAGFKNAIYALEAPKNDSTWSLEDARHSVIVYKPSEIANASGPNIDDPRTGEILESHVNWYHNVMQLLHDWYMVQAAPNDPKARKMEFDDSLMGQLIRFVSSHEIGHTLGLRHNFGASSSIPVDSLRNKKWVEANGFCPSIMDYARFNYVAQPQDSISAQGILPRIGVYDDWAINWGYKWLPDFKSAKDEKMYLNQWVINTISKDKRLWFGDGELIDGDPHSQTEDLGDDAVKASYYGIKNLQFVMNHILSWSYEPAEDYDKLTGIYSAIVGQYRTYMYHVARNIGGVYVTPKTMDEKGPIYSFPTNKRQSEAVAFLNEQLFTTPVWLNNQRLTGILSDQAPIEFLQNQLLYYLLSPSVLFRVAYNEKRQTNPYRFSQYLNDLKLGMWSELKSHKPIDQYRRTLQKSYILTLIYSLKEPPNPGPAGSAYFFWNSRFDVASLIKSQMRNLETEIGKALFQYKDETTRIHLNECKRILNEALTPKNDVLNSASNKKAFNIDDFSSLFMQKNLPASKLIEECEMWSENYH